MAVELLSVLLFNLFHDDPFKKVCSCGSMLAVMFVPFAVLVAFGLVALLALMIALLAFALMLALQSSAIVLLVAKYHQIGCSGTLSPTLSAPSALPSAPFQRPVAFSSCSSFVATK